MNEKPRINKEKGDFVYKSVKDRRNIPISLELHRILKLESEKQRRKIKTIVEEAIKSYLKI